MSRMRILKDNMQILRYTVSQSTTRECVAFLLSSSNAQTQCYIRCCQGYVINWSCPSVVRVSPRLCTGAHTTGFSCAEGQSL